MAEFCAARGVTLHRFAADAPVGHRSEEWSRELRYGYFARLAAQNGAKIATGQHPVGSGGNALFRLAGHRAERSLRDSGAAGAFVRPCWA